MELIKVKNYEEMSQKACALIVQQMIEEGGNTVLGLATGSTPEGLYRSLIEKYQHKKVSFKNIITFNLDEYVGMKNEDRNSYHSFMNEKLFYHIDIPLEQTHVPNGVAAEPLKECEIYEEKIRHAGGIDIQVLGLGINGHIGFNEPGTSFSSRTNVIDLTPSTLQANARFFNDISEVPTKAITMGIGTIMESKKIVIMVSGENKAMALSKLINGPITEDFPASILQKHENVIIIADEAACFLIK
ncbi:glucosamine-6-phosphate deaminase [Neobacillus sp. LXY-1]|uniref:glucosamine-6-phosphate deaminase n=1 Tax=Neobacillus sp. LXY-1 TaxID=3379133 RepID=UPI003EDE8670